MPDHEVFDAGDLVLQSGVTLPGVKLAYKTHGRLNAAGDNAIVYPTHYAGRHRDNEWLIGAGMALSPDDNFIVVPSMLGNGLSSSPSNTPAPFDGPRFPGVTLYDNVGLQHRLLTEHLGVRRVRLAIGHSMGALQAYHWGALYPDMVERIAPFCGSARTSRHNFVFLEGLKAALTADAAFMDGDYDGPPERGLRAFGRVYAGWGLSQAFYRQRLDERALGAPSLEAFLTATWEGAFLSWDANDLLAMLWSWQTADISANDLYDGDFERALGAISARALVMPSLTDLYFPPEDSRYEVEHLLVGECRPIPSIWGHMAGSGLNPEDVRFIDASLKDLLAS